MYVLSTVRTPIGVLNGSLSEFSVGQLSSIIIREALERAVVPPNDVQNVFMGCAFDDNFGSEVIKRTALPKSIKFMMSKCSLNSFVSGCEIMTEHNKKVCLIGGVESMSNNFPFKDLVESAFKMQSKTNNCDMTNFADIKPQNYKNYIPYDEVAKITFRKKGQQIIVSEDEATDKFQKIEVFHHNSKFVLQLNAKNLIIDLNSKAASDNPIVLSPGDGAMAGVIANEEYVTQNLLTPLAEVVSFAKLPPGAKDCTSLTQTIKKALDKTGFNSQSISKWSIYSPNQGILSSCIKHFNINPLLVNRNQIFNQGYPAGMYGGKIITSMIHSLSFKELGCASGIAIDGSSAAVVFKKLCNKTSEKPQLVLYTKKQCSLCDNLERDLEQYKDRFFLRKIDIEEEGNEKLRKLFEYEIPVLFLDGLFFCKHRLDLGHLNQRLLRSEQIRLENGKNG